MFAKLEADVLEDYEGRHRISELWQLAKKEGMRLGKREGGRGDEN